MESGIIYEWKMQDDREINYNLIPAVREGRLERVEELINSFGLCYSQKLADGYVLLCDALKNNRTEIAKLLLANGSKVNSINENPSMTPLHFAVRNGDLHIVELLLDKGANIDAESKDGSTPLHDAIRWNQLGIIESLIRRGASINAVGKYGITALHIATVEANTDIVAWLLSSHQANVNSVCTYGGNECCTPLYIAVKNGHEEVVKQLLEYGANVDAQDQDGKTILYLAVETGHVLIVEHLLKYSPDVNNISNRNAFNIAVHGCREEYSEIVENLLQYGFTVNLKYGNNCELLYEAIRKGYLKIVKKLINYGVSIDSKDIYSRTAVHIATEWTNPEIVKVLFKFSANINSKDRSGKAVLLIASDRDKPEIVKILLQSDASVNSKDAFGRTALHIAGCYYNLEIIKVLLKLSANVYSRDDDGNTALYIAFAKHNIEIVKALVQFGVNIDSENQGGRTALHIALAKRNLEIVKALVQFGDDIDSKDQRGRTALHIAFAKHNIEIVKALVQFGVKIDSKDKNGRTALHIACEKYNSEVVEVLLELGADVDSKNQRGKTALHIASGKGNIQIVNVLLKYGASTDSKDRHGKTALHYASLQKTWIYSASSIEIAKMIVTALLDHGSDITMVSETYYHESCAEILKRHAVKVKTANLNVMDRNSLISSNDEELSDFRNECEKEVASMKSENVGNSTISFYDILTKGISKLAIYAGNKSIEQVFGSDDYRTKFPIYATLINNNFRKGERRKDLRERCNEMFNFRFTNFLAIPYDCTEKILDYLSNDDLRTIMDACKPISACSLNTNKKKRGN